MRVPLALRRAPGQRRSLLCLVLAAATAVSSACLETPGKSIGAALDEARGADAGVDASRGNDFGGAVDRDGDRTPDGEDGCPLDPNKTSEALCGCGVSEGDADRDGSPDCMDACPENPMKVEPGVCGCDALDKDLNGDGTADCEDRCPLDPLKVAPGVCDCGTPDTDSDGDGTADCADGCPYEVAKVAEGACGCSVGDVDRDNDGTPDCLDSCPSDPMKVAPGKCGCATAEGTCSSTCSSELTPGAQFVVSEQRCSPNGQFTFGLDADGNLSLRQGTEVLWQAFLSSPAVLVKLQTDGNLVARSATGAALWSSGTATKSGATLTVESDGSVVLRQLGVIVWSLGPFQSGDLLCREARENQKVRLACAAGEMISTIELASYGKPTGACGSYAVDTACNYSAQSFIETECVGKNACEFLVDKAKFTIPCTGPKRLVVEYSCVVPDACPADPLKLAEGQCGCGTPDTDTDADGLVDCKDECADDANKTLRGACGCHVADTDNDGDGLANCADKCPDDPLKSAPGTCGCAVADVDRDHDGVPDCADTCPDDTNKTAAGECGCGALDSDSDGDGTANCQDLCPLDPSKVAPLQCGCGFAEGTCAPPCSNQLLSGAQLARGEDRCSTNGKFRFGLSMDGNVTLRESGDVVWSAFQSGAALTMRMQGDGNLVARDANSTSVWTTLTPSKTGAVLTVEDDGTVVLRQVDVVVWSLGPYRNGDSFCREARENQQAHLSCPVGQKISSFQFASYGKPTGACGSYAVDPTCNYSPQGFLDTNCVGQNTCDFLVDKAKFTIPCTGPKRLVVAYLCSGQ